MVSPDGETRPVLLRAHVSTSAVPHLRKHGRLLAKIDHPRVLRLLHITKASGRPLWIYEGFSGVSLSRVLQVLSVQDEHIPIRTCLDLVCAAAEGLRAGLGVGLTAEEGSEGLAVAHSGPVPGELLVDGAGQVKVAGFTIRHGTDAREEPPDGFKAPVDGGPEANAVYGLGALLVNLLSGEAPAVGSDDPDRHGSILRRALIRVLARPGEAAGDDVVTLIRECMGLDLDQRPGLTALIDRLSERAAEAQDAGLAAWAPVKISVVLQQQDTGYPSEEETRKRRYVDPTSLLSDEASFETPPIRRPPRELPTMVGKSDQGLNLAVGARKTGGGGASGNHPTLETEPARVARGLVPSADLSISLPLPESLPSPGAAMDIDLDTARPVGGVHLDIQPDGWQELDSPTQARRTSGWIMVGGVLAGMLCAGLLAWLAVDRLGGGALLSPDPVVKQAPVDPMQTGASADAMVDEMETPAVQDAPISQDAGLPAQIQVEPEVPVAPVPGRIENPTPPAQVKPVPPPVPVQPKAKVKDPPVPSDRFRVSFRSVDPSVSRMVVQCHIGKGSGTSNVRIEKAGRGPCKVIGFRGESERLVVSAVLTGARSFSCFRNGARVCE